MHSSPILQLVRKHKNLLSLFSKINARFGIHQIYNNFRALIKTSSPYNALRNVLRTKKNGYYLGIVLDIVLIAFVTVNGVKPAERLISPLFHPNDSLQSLKQGKNGYEVMGFAPSWTFEKLDNVNFDVLTTMAYFGIDVAPDGELVKAGPGYETFVSDKATQVFQKAHAHGTRVVLTITSMNNSDILALMDDPAAQDKAISETVDMVKKRGIDGVNVDMEYTGNPGVAYRNKFSDFIANLTRQMHDSVPSSRVTVSVYASAVKDPKIYDIASLGKSADGIFMMAYDFAVAGSDNAIPTAPLYGYKEKKYWYDVSTAVNDFLTQMPANKLILGVPWYGYNYAVNQPAVKAAVNNGYYQYYTYKRRTYSYYVPIPSKTQTYSIVNEITDTTPGITSLKTGWDDIGKVGYKAYYDQTYGTWRMVFIDDVKSLAIKYDFAKDKKLGGVGMWALGFDSGKSDMWDLLADKFGSKIADSSIVNKDILEEVR